MRNILFIVAVALVSCNSDQTTKKVSEKVPRNSCFSYPPEIDSLQIQDLYDTARWYVYTRYCDVLYQPKTEPSSTKTFGELELKFDHLFLKNDTAALIFDFIDNGRPVFASMLNDDRQLATGMSFDITSKKKLYLISSNAAISYSGDPTHRYANPLQPEVIRFIKDNWNKLNSCFREIALKHGIRNEKEGN